MIPNKISEQTKLQVAYNAGKGYPIRENGYKCGISKSSVSRILQFMNKVEIPNQRIDPFTQFRFHFVAFNILKNPHVTNQIIAHLSSKYEFKMSESTVGRNSVAIGFKSKFQQKNEKLSDKQKE